MDKLTQAAQMFEDIIAYQPSNKSESDLREAAMVKLGHIFFSKEPPEIAKAAEQYGLVPKESDFYDEALLGLGWSFLKVRKMDQALALANKIINRDHPYLKAEAHLVKGYAFFMKKEWGDAIASLDKCIKLTKAPLISKAEVAKKEKEFSSSKSKFSTVQTDAIRLARLLPTERVNKQRDKLRPKVDSFNKMIDDYFKFKKRELQSSRFETNRARILEDAEFTRTEAIARKGGGGVSTPVGGDDDGLGLDDL